MAFEIEFYKTKDGKEPVADFLDSLDDKMAAKLVGLMEVLEEKGTELRMPYSEYLDDASDWGTKRYLNMDHLFQMELMNNTETAEASAG